MKPKDFDGGKSFDLHGKTTEYLETLVDRLFLEKEVVQIVTGNGKGILKEHLYFLQKKYGFRILSVSNNDAAFVIDFSD